MLTYAFDLLYAIYEEEGYGPAEIPGLILANNLHGTEIDPRAGALAAFALTMKARARQRTFLNKQIGPNVCVINPISFGPQELDFLVTGGGDRPHEEVAFWNQFIEAATFGSLIQPNSELTSRLARHLATLRDGGDMMKADVLDRADRVIVQSEYLSSRYVVVVANPPYMGSGNMSGALAAWLKTGYPNTRYDLMTAFMARATSLCVDGGLYGMINLPSWMFLSSYASMRSELLKRSRIASMLHLGRGVFGSDFGSVAFVICNQPPTLNSRGVYRRLFDTSSEVRSNSVIEARFQERDRDLYEVEQKDLESLPGKPIAYWLSSAMRKAFLTGRPMIELAEPRQGLATADNARFVRQWWEVSARRCSFGSSTRSEAKTSGARWFPYTDGGDFRRWYGNLQSLVNWGNDGQELRDFSRSVIRNPDFYFRESVAWSAVGSGAPAFRYMPMGSLFSNAGMALFADHDTLKRVAAVCNSTTGGALFAAIAPTVNLGVGEMAKLPVVAIPEGVEAIVDHLIERAKLDWDDFETSWDFQRPSLLPASAADSQLRGLVATWAQSWREAANAQRELEAENNRIVAAAYGLAEEIALDVPQHRVSLKRNVEFIFGPGRTEDDYVDLQCASIAEELVSYSVGCMFGRYSLDEPGLIVADQGTTLQDYLAKAPSPRFPPDKDNVIPVVDGEWFEDDIVARFRQFLRAAFGVQHFEENLRFVTESLGVKDLRDYFVKSFYKDHIQRYKRRPIYWLFSSPKGSFNALIYMHRYTPSTVSTVLNEYLREFQAKLNASREHAERSNNAKEADRLREVLLELNEYEHDVLYPLATQNIVIDLDDGVKANYPKFGDALKKVSGLEAIE